MNDIRLKRLSLRHPYLFALLLLLIALGVNLCFQPNLLSPRVLSGNMRIFLPGMFLAAGQAIVIIGGGIDLSVGAMVSMVNTILVTLITRESSTSEIVIGLLAALGAGMAAGAFNGVCIALLRLRPIVTTYATSFIFSGVALYILPRPGGLLPGGMTDLYRAAPLGLPIALWAAVLIGAAWVVVRRTRYARFLFAVGGEDEAAYATGVPVYLMRFSTYVVAGLMAALSALVLTLNTGSGDPRIGAQMTLSSIVAVVLGGTRLSGGQGGVIGTLIGVVILGTIRNIISFAQVATWWETLVDALIVVGALAGPGLIRLIRGEREAP